MTETASRSLSFLPISTFVRCNVSTCWCRQKWGLPAEPQIESSTLLAISTDLHSIHTHTLPSPSRHSMAATNYVHRPKSFCGEHSTKHRQRSKMKVTTANRCHAAQKTWMLFCHLHLMQPLSNLKH